MADVCRPGTAVAHEADQVRRYLNVDACPAHTPAAIAGRPEPAGQYQLTPLHQTLPSTEGASDINKKRPGGYVSRQRAQRIADGTAPRQENAR